MPWLRANGDDGTESIGARKTLGGTAHPFVDAPDQCQRLVQQIRLSIPGWLPVR